MREVFADAGYWISLNNTQDSLHDRARLITQQLEPDGYRVITSEMVLVELLNFASKGGQYARKRAADVVRSLSRNPNVEIVPQTSPRFAAALDRYENRLDQRWSLTDCSSFLTMEERGITEALAYDRDFERAGFKALLRES